MTDGATGGGPGRKLAGRGAGSVASQAVTTIPGFGPRSRDGGLDQVPLPADHPGALWLCGKHVVGPDPEAALARADDADVIVCLSQPHEIDVRFPDYTAWLRANQGGRALWWPVPDLHAPPIDDARLWVDELVARLGRGEGLIIHCGGGIGRAPTLAVCVLIALGATAADAVAHVAAHRPMAGPESGAQAELVAAF